MEIFLMALKNNIRFQREQAKINELIDSGAWLKLAYYILQFGSELIQYIRERRKEKSHVPR